MAEKKAAAKPKADTRSLGSLWDVPGGSIVARPDGVVVSTGPGGHVLDIAGTYTCGDETVTAK